MTDRVEVDVAQRRFDDVGPGLEVDDLDDDVAVDDLDLDAGGDRVGGVDGEHGDDGHRRRRGGDADAEQRTATAVS